MSFQVSTPSSLELPSTTSAAQALASCDFCHHNFPGHQPVYRSLAVAHSKDDTYTCNEHRLQVAHAYFRGNAAGTPNSQWLRDLVMVGFRQTAQPSRWNQPMAGCSRLLAIQHNDPHLRLDIEFWTDNQFAGRTPPATMQLDAAIPYFQVLAPDRISDGSLFSIPIHYRVKIQMVRSANQWHTDADEEYCGRYNDVPKAEIRETVAYREYMELTGMPLCHFRMQMPGIPLSDLTQVPLIEVGNHGTHHETEGILHVTAGEVGIRLLFLELWVQSLHPRSGSQRVHARPFFCDVSTEELCSVRGIVSELPAPAEETQIFPNTDAIGPEKEDGRPFIGDHFQFGNQKYSDYDSKMATWILYKYREERAPRRFSAELDIRKSGSYLSKPQKCASPLGLHELFDADPQTVYTRLPQTGLNEDNFLAVTYLQLRLGILGNDLASFIHLPGARIVNARRATTTEADEGERGNIICDVEVLQKNVNIKPQTSKLLLEFEHVPHAFRLSVTDAVLESSHLAVQATGADGILDFYERPCRVSILPDNFPFAQAVSSLDAAYRDKEETAGVPAFDTNQELIFRATRCEEGNVFEEETALQQEESRKRRAAEAVKKRLEENLRALWNPNRAKPKSYVPPHLKQAFAGLRVHKAHYHTLNSILDGTRYQVMWGGPGAGKTTCSAAMLLALFIAEQSSNGTAEGPASKPSPAHELGDGWNRKPKGWLFVSTTNTATDEACRALRKRCEEASLSTEERPTMRRIYASSLPKSDWAKDLHDYSTSEMFPEKGEAETPLADTDVIFMTINLALARIGTLFMRGLFRGVVIDECGRTPMALGLPLSLLANQMIVVGDHLQMAPFLHTKLDFLREIFLDISLLQLVYDIGHPNQLFRDNFRSTEAILVPSNRFIYPDSQMVAARAAERTEQHRLLLENCPTRQRWFLNPGFNHQEICGIEEKLMGTASYANLYEAKAAIDATEDLANSRLPDDNWTLGILSFYNGQREVLEHIIEKRQAEGRLSHSLPWLKILSAEKFQGLDSDFLIICGTRASPDEGTGTRSSKSLGFLRQPSRSNVAFTRARLAVLLICQAGCFQTNDMWREAILQANASCQITHPLHAKLLSLPDNEVYQEVSYAMNVGLLNCRIIAREPSNPQVLLVAKEVPLPLPPTDHCLPISTHH